MVGDMMIINTDAEAAQKISQVLIKFDDILVQRVVAAGIRIRALSPGEKYADVSSVINKLNFDVDMWPVPPAGLFVVDERSMYLRSLSDMTIAHEFGHAIDYALGDGAYFSERSLEVQAAFRSASKFVTPYAASRVDEYFAEAVRAYIGVNDARSRWPKVSRKKLAECDPKMFRLVEKLLNPQES